MAFLLPFAAMATIAWGQQAVGVRPYELDWAGRFRDDHPALVDFEQMGQWRVETENSVASFTQSREQQLWGDYVAKLTYRFEKGTSTLPTTSTAPAVYLRPPEPIAIGEPFDAVSMWVYGNTWSWRNDSSTPQIDIRVLFADSQGQEFGVDLIRVRWEEWFLCHKRLTPEQTERVRRGASFTGFRIGNGRQPSDRVVYFDNLAVFTEQFPPLHFRPRPARGIDVFPGQDVGANTGPGRLPFPNRPETILPANLAERYTTTLTQEGEEFVFTYLGEEGTLTYRIRPTGRWDDIVAQWQRRGGSFRPCVGGGIYLHTAGGHSAPRLIEPLSVERRGEELHTEFRLSAGEVSAQAQYVFRLWGKSLVIDTICRGGQVAEVRYGALVGLDHPRLVTIPYYHYNRQSRPAVVVSGPPDEPLFVAGNTDWYLSNASEPFALNQVTEGQVLYNGGTRYIPKTNGERNDCYERFFVTVTPRFEETLPTIPNPVSPWKHITGTRFWRPHGAGDRERDKAYWRRFHRLGVTEMVVTDHETMWRDGGESFTFRVKAAPKKGGDQGAYDYARFMQDELGYIYGPYNNFTDFAPVNEHWHVDRVSRTPDNQLQHAWMRCYAPKPAYAVQACEELAPQIEDKFHFSTAYCDVHTAVAPWDRVDYDYRSPGAGTFAAVFYAFGEIMMLQKAAWDGPVYSEGNMHFPYCGLTDGNYAQDRGYNLVDNPWLVDFDLRCMHDLCCNFGMGMPSMYYGEDYNYGSTDAEVDANLDRFAAATVAFGHPGYLTSEGGERRSLRYYWSLQQLHSRYCLASPEQILYADAQGKLLPTTEAVATGTYARSQLVTRYSDGTVTVVNGNKAERMRVQVFGRELDLPPNGYAGWTADRQIEVLSSDHLGHRCDYAVTPAYLFVDGRGTFTRFPRAASAGLAVCRTLDRGRYEVIPYQGAECGFAVDATSAVALDEAGKELGPAQLRRARGLTYVVPVPNAFSYLLQAGQATPDDLACERDRVVPGEKVLVRGQHTHELRIPQDARPGDRIWQQLEGRWIDFTVVPLALARPSLQGNVLTLQLTSNAPSRGELAVTLGDETQTLHLAPGETGTVTFDLGEPEHEDVLSLDIELRSGQLAGRLEYGMRILQTMVELARLPGKWEVGMRLRGQEEAADFGTTRANVRASSTTCNGVTREGIFMHPPYVGGVGYAYLLYDPVQLPAQPAAVFRAWVGKGDGSDLGDGIFYRIAVVDEAGRETVVGEQHVASHEWKQIEGDLSRWAGQRVRIKLVTDCGPNDNTSGDWGAWAGMRLETQQPQLVRLLDLDPERYRREDGPFMISGLSLEDLRSARRGWLHYDGIGLSGTGEAYGSFAVLNGIELGNMAPAGGREAENVWDENKGVPLTSEAIATLGFRNTFELRNPRRDYFKVRRFWLELELADGRKCSSYISTATFTQPPTWPYAEGISVPFTESITQDIWFPR